MVGKKSKFVIIASIVLILFFIASSISLTIAYFKAKDDASGSLAFASTKITANDGWFSSAVSGKITVKPGTQILSNDIKFNLKEGSSPVYIRVKYKVDLLEGSNEEVKKVYNYLKYRNLELTTAADYSWSKKLGDYYYLMNSAGTAPLEVSAVRATDYTFLTATNSTVSTDLEYSSANVNDQTIKLSLGIEAVQTANINEASSNAELIKDIEAALNTKYSIETTGTFTATFNVNGTTYSVNNIAYGTSTVVPAAVQTAMASNFDGFALWNNGLAVIKNGTNNHSYLSSNTIYNITDDVTFYVKSTTQKRLVIFKNADNTVLQASYVNNGENAQYLGITPTKVHDDASKIWVFNGWNESLENITEDKTFIALFVEQAV